MLGRLASSSLTAQQADDLVSAVSELLALVFAAPEGRPAEIAINGVELGSLVRVTVSWLDAPLSPGSPDPSPFATAEATHRFLSETYVDRWSYTQDQGRSQVILEKYPVPDMCQR